MVPEKPSNQTQFDLFRLQLDNIINRNHELYRLAEMIDWSVFDESFGSLYCPNKGCPGKPTSPDGGSANAEAYVRHV